jgi:hypothetical protein
MATETIAASPRAADFNQRALMVMTAEVADLLERAENMRKLIGALAEQNGLREGIDIPAMGSRRR